MSYLNAEQKIAETVGEVQTKIEEIISEQGIDTDEVKFVKVVPFGASLFLCLVVYAMLREVRTLSAKVGLIASYVSKSVLNRGLSTKLGLKSSLSKKLGSKQTISSKMGLISVISYLKNLNKTTSITLGMRCSGVAQKNSEDPINIV
jgi:hypothetical protein